MKRTVTIAVAAALSAAVLGAGSATASTAPHARISAHCDSGVHVQAAGFTPSPGYDNLYAVVVYTKGVPQWTFGYFDTQADVRVSIPHDGLHHRVFAYVHNHEDGFHAIAQLSKRTKRCRG